jgi:hypothetical protein
MSKSAKSATSMPSIARRCARDTPGVRWFWADGEWR